MVLVVLPIQIGFNEEACVVWEAMGAFGGDRWPLNRDRVS